MVEFLIRRFVIIDLFLISKEHKELTEENGFIVNHTVVQNLNNIKQCEGYDIPYRTILRRIRRECADLDNNLVLKSAVNPMNDTVGANGLVSSPLVFVSYLR